MNKDLQQKFKCTRTRVSENLKALPIIPFCIYRKYHPEYYKAKPLLDICADIHNSKPQPWYWNCTPEEIADWILEGADHPEFHEAFIKNEIDGKSLIFLEADKFSKINIKEFDIIKGFTAKIRGLCQLDQDEFKRSISLPIRRPQTLFLWYKALHTGPTAYYMTPSKYFKIVHMIPEEVACGPSYYDLLNHWNRIPSFMPWCPHVMIGGNKRLNSMTGTTQRQNFQPKDHPYLLREHALCMYHFPCNFEFPIKKDSLESGLPKRRSSCIFPCD